MNSNQCHYNQGIYKKIALIFSCPGQEEEIKGQPTSGTTGTNLEYFLSQLYLNQNFNFRNRYDFRISNSVSEVHFKERTNRTEPLISTIKKKDNIIRLYNEIKDIETLIICFGKKAEIAIKEVLKRYNSLTHLQIIYSPHIGLQSLNRKKYNCDDELLKGSDKIKYKLNFIINEKFSLLSKETII